VRLVSAPGCGEFGLMCWASPGTRSFSDPTSMVQEMLSFDMDNIIRRPDGLKSKREGFLNVLFINILARIFKLSL